MLIILIITLLSITEATAVLCTKNVSIFTVELRDEIADALNDSKEIDTSDIQCAEIGSKCIVAKSGEFKLPYMAQNFDESGLGKIRRVNN